MFTFGKCLTSSHVIIGSRLKHYDLKWRKLRAAKVLKMNLPDFDESIRNQKLSPEEMRSKMKREGQHPPRRFDDKPMLISCTGSVFEPYVPPEGDGLASIISEKGVEQRFTELKMKGKSFMQMRKIKPFEDDFDSKIFSERALDIYIEAHQLLENISKNEDKLHELVTEKAYPEMVWKLDKKTVRWRFIESLEPARVVHVRTTDLLSKENVYAQLTVRFHCKQILAIYDRFGRLAFGSEELPKDCLEYVVYEKHLSDEYGNWRIHGKIIPEHIKATSYPLRTLAKPQIIEQLN